MHDLEFEEQLRLCELALVTSLIPPPPQRLLEIGAGAGWQSRSFADLGYEVSAVDIRGSSYAGSRVWRVDEYDGENLPFGAEQFDIVFSSSVLEHIPHVERFQAEIRRVLKDDGVAIHVVPSGFWRFWTSAAHYPELAKRLFARALPGSQRSDRHRTNEAAPSHEPADKLERPRIRDYLFAPRHGETGTAMSELYLFSRRRWVRLFQRTGWQIGVARPTGLFYTGYGLLGGKLSVQKRRRLSGLIGSACSVFALSKTGMQRVPR